MVDSISNFCVSIICTIMVIIIIEMIMPDGKNKKYVMFVCGLVVTLSLIEPIINLLKMDLEEVFSENLTEYSEYKVDKSLYDDTLKKSYEKVLVDDIVNRLKENGYDVSAVKIEYDETTFEPIRIYMNLEGEAGFVQPVKIEVGKGQSDRKNDVSKMKIRNIVSEDYGVTKDNVIIN